MRFSFLWLLAFASALKNEAGVLHLPLEKFLS